MRLLSLLMCLRGNENDPLNLKYILILFHYFCIPLNMDIKDGLEETSSREGGDGSNAASHVVQMIRNGHEAASVPGSGSLFPYRSDINRIRKTEPDSPLLTLLQGLRIPALLTKYRRSDKSLHTA